MNKDDKVQGEGNYDAARNYREKTEKFVESGKVEQQKEDLTNISKAEQAELEKAEQIGKERALEENPAVTKGESSSK